MKRKVVASVLCSPLVAFVYALVRNLLRLPMEYMEAGLEASAKGLPAEDSVSFPAAIKKYKRLCVSMPTSSVCHK